MREDMAKIIVERPRPQSRTATSDDPKGWKKRVAGKYAELEDLPTRESMSRRRKYGWDAKELNENLNPLRRYLEKSAGRPWDKVYAEICERINPNSAVQNHILQHVYDFVESHTFLEGNKVYYRFQYGWRSTNYEPIEKSYKGLYIHPANGLLLKIKKKKEGKRKRRERRKAEELASATCLMVPGIGWFKKINGCWFGFDMRYIPEKLFTEGKYITWRGVEEMTKIPTNAGRIHDVYLGQSLFFLSRYPNNLRSAYGRTDIYCAGFRQASSKDLKKAGLVNDREEE
jgi:hypothetical protein